MERGRDEKGSHKKRRGFARVCGRLGSVYDISSKLVLSFLQYLSEKKNTVETIEMAQSEECLPCSLEDLIQSPTPR